MAKTGFSISDDTRDRLRALSFVLHVPMARLIEEGVDYRVASLSASERAAYEAARAIAGHRPERVGGGYE